MKPQILIISRYQFGYHTDVYKWCCYLRNSYNVDIVTLNAKRPKKDIENINIHYVPRTKNRMLNGLFFVICSIWYMLRFKGIIWIHHFPGCSIFKKIFPKKNFILDIRSLSVSQNKEYREQLNKKIKKDTETYDYVTVISEGVRKQLSLPESKSSILPLGSEPFCDNVKEYNSLKLIYVGSLTNRNILETVKGLVLFTNKHPDIDIKYDIIGDGEDSKVINEFIVSENLLDKVRTYGFIHHSELKPFFEKCNVGVSYVPQTDYYDFQPPTKTFEYILSGLYTIATNTFANREIISDINGCLVDDNAESFAKGLEYVWSKRKEFKTEKIKESLSEYSWESIVEKYMIPILDKRQRK